MAETNTPGMFIPRDTAAAPVNRRRHESGGLNDLLLLSSVVLLVASIALAAGVFLYQQYLQAQAASEVAQLKRAEAAFEPSLIQQLTRLDDRMHAGETILKAHVAPSAFFDALSASTLQTVSFKSLDYEQTDPSHITIKMQGVARSVNSIALQADMFSKSGVITSPIFSNIAREADGVHFNLSADVNPAAVNYESIVAANTPAAPATTTPAGSTPGTSAAPFGTAAPATSTSQ